MPSLSSVTQAFGHFLRRARLRELLLWCLPALICGGLARALLLAHFPYGYVHPDSPDFLVTADRYLNHHHHFVLHGKKAFLGPILFLLPMMVKIPSLIIIPWAQHISGLVYTLMVGAIVRCWTRFWKCWIIPATLLAALNPALLYYEHALIAESQYMFCVTALLLAGAAFCGVSERACTPPGDESRRDCPKLAGGESPRYPATAGKAPAGAAEIRDTPQRARRETWPRFILFLLALLLTAGSRPEGKLYVLFCLLLVPLVLWGQWRRLALFSAVALAASLMIWMSTRNTQAGLLLYATLLPLSPETPKSAPDFGPLIAPLRTARLAKGLLYMPDFVREEKRITAVVYPYLQSKGRSTKTAGDFCQRLSVEAALNKPFLLPLVVFDKFLLGTELPTNDGFGLTWLQDIQFDSCTYKPWMLKLMPLMTGLPIHTRDDLAAYIHREFTPLRPDWFNALQRIWFFATTGARIPWPGQTPGTPGLPLAYLLGVLGMAAGMICPGNMRELHIAWVITLAFTAAVVMLTGVVNPRYRFVFEPFVLLYLFVLADAIVALIVRRPRHD